MKRAPGYNLLALLTIMVLAAACASEEKVNALMSTYQEKVHQAGDLAKNKMVNAAAHAYAAEHGEAAESLDELVQEGYLSESDIIDHEGQRIRYSPDEILPREGVVKTCGACKKAVSSQAKAGDTCPHCGVVWGMELPAF